MASIINYFNYLKPRLNRNQFGIRDIPSIRKTVNIERSPLVNVGDSLGPVIVKWMLKKRNIDPLKKVKRTKHLMTVGSIIGRGRFDTTVWGSGVLKTVGDISLMRYKQLYHRKIDFRAIRGPYSREYVISHGYSCPEVYGDPAVLMPLIYSPRMKKIYDCSVILHHRTSILDNTTNSNDEYSMKINSDVYQKYHPHFIDPKTEDYKFFIDELLKSKFVISSSLHGIILAESYGIPSVFLNWGVDDQPTKFRDWYASTGRETVFCRTLEEAFNTSAPPLPDISILQNNLMNSFPYDLWEV
ncbi:MAG: polysaccharide pyruvyl transferase family protein [Clostridia bacterium]|nr:polysaccharide pyruvyl transferase family protein [Clostridia bacterium]